jgi:hypothetical protein
VFGGKLPFVGRIFWKILIAVFALVILVFGVAVRFFEYEMTRADYFGSVISGILLSYLLHLWMLPAEYYPAYEDDEDLDDEPVDHAHGTAGGNGIEDSNGGDSAASRSVRQPAD